MDKTASKDITMTTFTVNGKTFVLGRNRAMGLLLAKSEREENKRASTTSNRAVVTSTGGR